MPTSELPTGTRDGRCSSATLERVKKYQLNVTVEPLEDGRFLATSGDLQGCLAEGDTIAEALENIEDAARAIIEARTERGWPLPPELSTEESRVVQAKVVVRVGV